MRRTPQATPQANTMKTKIISSAKAAGSNGTTEQAVRMLRAYEGRVAYWLAEANKYNRATLGRREAVAYANAFCCMVDDLRLLVPKKYRQPPDAS